MTITHDHLEALSRIVGSGNVITDTYLKESYEHELRDFFKSESAAVVLPTCTEQVSQVVEYCYQQRIQMVPQGGNTGTVGGAVAQAHQIIINLNRMNRLRDCNLIDNTMTIESGCILEQVKQWAQQHERFFPLSLAAQGSCQIGGNLATNAGGVNVLKYGNMRDLVLGIEAVMPDGRILHGLSDLRKDNSGYDLRNLLIGSEGTLGIITAATVKLFHPMVETITAWLALDDLTKLPIIKSELEVASQQNLISFELMSKYSVELVLKHFPALSLPFQTHSQWHVLVVVGSLTTESPFDTAVFKCIEQHIENKVIEDVAIAQNMRQSQDIIAIREYIPEAQKQQGRSIKNDISIPIKHIIDFIDEGESLLRHVDSALRPCIFGHIGDGNLHFNVSIDNAYGDDIVELERIVHQKINALVAKFSGSFSAEHGVGKLKTQYMQQYKDKTSLEMMYLIKNALDPYGLMNPHKILPEPKPESKPESIDKTKQ